MRREYAIGAAQWGILHYMLDDSGPLTTQEIATGVGREGSPGKVRRKLETLKKRGLINEDTVGRRQSVWTLRVHNQ